MKTAATTIALDQKAYLITGPAGIGKSALALALMERGGQLVSDDVTDIQDGYAFAPQYCRGCLEVRGIGIVSGLPVCEKAPVAAEIRITPEKPERIPVCEAKSIPAFTVWAEDKNQADKVMIIHRILEQKLTLK